MSTFHFWNLKFRRWFTKMLIQFSRFSNHITNFMSEKNVTSKPEFEFLFSLIQIKFVCMNYFHSNEEFRKNCWRKKGVDDGKDNLMTLEDWELNCFSLRKIVANFHTEFFIANFHTEWIIKVINRISQLIATSCTLFSVYMLWAS